MLCKCPGQNARKTLLAYLIIHHHRFFPQLLHQHSHSFGVELQKKNTVLLGGFLHGLDASRDGAVIQRHTSPGRAQIIGNFHGTIIQPYTFLLSLSTVPLPVTLRSYWPGRRILFFCSVVQTVLEHYEIKTWAQNLALEHSPRCERVKFPRAVRHHCTTLQEKLHHSREYLENRS